jgi:soluble cytochrome b562
MILQGKDATSVAHIVRRLREMRQKLVELARSHPDEDLVASPEFSAWANSYDKLTEGLRDTYEERLMGDVERARQIIDQDDEDQPLRMAEANLDKVKVSTGPIWYDGDFEEPPPRSEDVDDLGVVDTASEIDKFASELEQLAKPLKVSKADRRRLEAYAEELEQRAALIRKWLK